MFRVVTPVLPSECRDTEPIASRLKASGTSEPAVRATVFDGYDHASPFFQNVSSALGFRLNPNREAYQTVKGETFCGPNNVGYKIDKRCGPNRDISHQRVALFSNHGEVAGWVAWNHQEGFFGHHNPLSFAHVDGHGDEMRARTSQKRATDRKMSHYEHAKTNSHRNGIASFIASLVQDGVVDPNRWYFKSLVDHWPAQHFWYQEKPRFIGAQATTSPMQFDQAIEHGVLDDQQIAESVPEVADLDMDYLYYVEDPTEIALAIMKTVKSAYYSPLVNLVTSPGWLDEELGVTFARIHALLLEVERPTEDLNREVDRLVDRLEGLAATNREAGRLGKGDETLYSAFLNDTSEIRTEMKQLFALSFDAPELSFSSQVPEDGKAQASFYYKDVGNFDSIKVRSAVTGNVEVRCFLLPALGKSPYAGIVNLAENYTELQPATETELRERASRLPDIPGDGPMRETFEAIAPTDYATAKIAWHLVNTFSRSEADILDDLKLLLRALKATDLTEQPLEFRHSLLAFFHVFGVETGLYQYGYHPLQQHLGQIDNWAGRFRSTQGVITENRFARSVRNAMDTGFIGINDIANELELGGGGVVVVEIGRNGESRNLAFGYHTGQQDQSKIYANAVVEGFLYFDTEQGRWISPLAEESPHFERWEVTDRDLRTTHRRTKNERFTQLWQAAPPREPTERPRDTIVERLETLLSLAGEALAVSRESLLLEERAPRLSAAQREGWQGFISTAERCQEGLRSYNFKVLWEVLDEVSAFRPDLSNSEELPDGLLNLYSLFVSNDFPLNSLVSQLYNEFSYELEMHLCRRDYENSDSEISFERFAGEFFSEAAPMDTRVFRRLIGFSDDLPDVGNRFGAHLILVRMADEIFADSDLGFWRIDATALTPEEHADLRTIIYDVNYYGYRDGDLCLRDASVQQKVFNWMAKCAERQRAVHVA